MQHATLVQLKLLHAANLTPLRFVMPPIPHSVATNVFVRAVAIYVCGFLFFLLMCAMASAQSYTSTSATTAWNAARWNNTADAAPYTSAYTANNAVSFTSGTYTFAGMGASTNVGNVTVASGVTVNFASIGSTFATGGNVRTFNIGSGALFDFQGQAISTAAGTGFIKSGDGVLATGAGTFTGGFTLNAGTVIARGTTGLGSGATNTLTLNGGTLAANGSRTFANTRFGGGITIGGNVQFGALATEVSLSNSTANLVFDNNVSLGAVNRTLTQGSNGSHGFTGVISNSGSGGITFAALSGTDGRFDITNAANTFTGDINVNGGEVRFTTDGSMGNAANDIIIDGGRFSKASDATTVTLGAGRTIAVGDGVGTGISSPGSGVLIYNGVIANKSGETGSWAKQGGGTLTLGGVSTYTGDTAINNGTVQLTTGNDRLPTTTTVSLGQSASANLGILDLNGRSQQIAGLNSVTGTNATASNNTVTSTTAATLTLGGSGSYSYGDGTDANSGTITGSITLVKSGGGTQTFGEANTYTGKTTITGGFIAGSGESVFGTNPGSFSADQITLNGGGVKATGNISFNSNRGITLGSGGGTLDTNGSSISLTNEVTGSGLLTKQGAGTLTLNSANTHSGGVTVTAGSVAVKNTTGSATGSGDVTVTGSTILGTGRVSPASGGSVIFGNASILSVGDAGDTSGKKLIFTPASGTMSTTFQSGSVVEFDLFTGAGSGDNSGIGTSADALQWGGTLALQSNVKLRVNNPNSMTTFAEGDSWKVLDWTTFGGSAPTGTFEASMLELPTLTGLLGWDTSNLYTAGTIGIIQVPEPSRAVLMLGGLLAIVIRRRR
jgi:autotransporter-associated beta strand protein